MDDTTASKMEYERVVITKVYHHWSENGLRLSGAYHHYVESRIRSSGGNKKCHFLTSKQKCLL